MPDASSLEAAPTSLAAPRDLILARCVTFGAVALSFPVSGVSVFAFDVDRHAAANLLSLVYSIGLVLALSTPYWPLPGLRRWTRGERLESFVLAFLAMSYLTHLSWELGWLVLHDSIARSPDAAWAYGWWAYIDGGDARYARSEPGLLAMESLSVVNGLVGATSLARFIRSKRTDRVAVLVLAATAVVHLYSASLYYLGELVAGLPNVDTSSTIATYFKFGLANAPWVIAPLFVFAWAKERIARRV